jgi:hypothetical protein
MPPAPARPGPAELLRRVAAGLLVLGLTCAGAAGTETRLSPEAAARLMDWSPDYVAQCLLPGEGATATELADLAAVRAALADETLLGGHLARILDASGVVLCRDATARGCRGYFDPEAGVIALRDGLTQDEMMLIAVHELRHLEQSARGFGLSLDYARAEIARQTFALEADAQAIAVLWAWEARAAGRPGPWAALAEMEHYADLGGAFATAMVAEGDAAAATRATFAAWYASDWRRERYYLTSCTRYLETLERSWRIESYASLPPEHFDDLCLMPDGTNYGCHETAEIRSGK